MVFMPSCINIKPDESSVDAGSVHVTGFRFELMVALSARQVLTETSLKDAVCHMMEAITKQACAVSHNKSCVIPSGHYPPGSHHASTSKNVLYPRHNHPSNHWY